jgi:hypothetical protein
LPAGLAHSAGSIARWCGGMLAVGKVLAVEAIACLLVQHPYLTSTFGTVVCLHVAVCAYLQTLWVERLTWFSVIRVVVIVCEVCPLTQLAYVQDASVRFCLG